MTATVEHMLRRGSERAEERRAQSVVARRARREAIGLLALTANDEDVHRIGKEIIITARDRESLEKITDHRQLEAIIAFRSKVRACFDSLAADRDAIARIRADAEKSRESQRLRFAAVAAREKEIRAREKEAEREEEIAYL